MYLPTAHLEQSGHAVIVPLTVGSYLASYATRVTECSTFPGPPRSPLCSMPSRLHMTTAKPKLTGAQCSRGVRRK